MIEKIKTKVIRDFTAESLARFSDGKTSDRAEKFAEVLHARLTAKGFISEHSDPSFGDAMIAAALLHDLFENEKEGWITVFYARLYLQEVAVAVGLPEPTYKAIFETIESQMGDDSAVPRTRPQPGMPQELFANDLWVVKNFLK